jgi:hypothetical protein
MPRLTFTKVLIACTREFDYRSEACFKFELIKQRADL